MPSRDDWVRFIRSREGKVSGDGNGNHRHPTLLLSFADKYTWIDAFWIYNKPGDNRFKGLRDDFAREMRKDGWEVTVGMTENRLEYFLFAKRRK